MLDQLVMTCIRAAQLAVRKLVPANLDGARQAEPLSRCFGFDRGRPIDRYYIERFLEENGASIRGDVLEIGDSVYSRKFQTGGASTFSVLKHEALPRAGRAIVGDLTDLDSLPASAFDCLICVQTLQYVFDVGAAVRGTHHLLREGGVLLATVPGISQISRYDSNLYGEYWRFTPDSVRRLLEPVFRSGLKVLSFGNVLSSTAFLQGAAVEDLPDRAPLDFCDQDYPLIVAAIATK